MAATLLSTRARTLALIVAAAVLAAAGLAVAGSRNSTSNAQAATAGIVTVQMKVTGQKTGAFKGDSTQKGREDQIDVFTYHFELDAPRDASSGQATGKRTYKPLTVTHALDAASPQFLAAAATGENLTSVVINFWKTDRTGKQTNYYRVTLTDAFISSVKHDSAGQTVQEEDAFGFRKIVEENLVARTTFEDNFLSPVS